MKGRIKPSLKKKWLQQISRNPMKNTGYEYVQNFAYYIPLSK